MITFPLIPGVDINVFLLIFVGLGAGILSGFTGVGAEIAALVQERAFDHLDAPIKRVATPDVIIPVNRNLERTVFPQEEQVVEAVKSIL